MLRARTLSLLLVGLLCGCWFFKGVRDDGPGKQTTSDGAEGTNLLDGEYQPVEFPDGVDREASVHRLSYGRSPSRVDTLYSASSIAQQLRANIHNQFARRSRREPDTFVPSLAKRIVRSPDGKTYTIHLREGVLWHRPAVDTSKSRYAWLHERRELTAEDCVYAFRFFSTKWFGLTSAQRRRFREFERAEVVDRYTCRVVWSQKSSRAAHTVMTHYPLPKFLYTHGYDGNDINERHRQLRFNEQWRKLLIGTGPFRFVQKKGITGVVLERFDKYWGETPAIRRLDWRQGPLPDPTFDGLVSGKFDFAVLSGKTYTDRVQKDDVIPEIESGELQHEVVDTLGFSSIDLNLRKKPFSNRKVRIALTHAFDRRRAIREKLHGLARLQTGPYPPAHPASNDDVEPYSYDLDRARRLLEEAGWKHRDDDQIREKPRNGELVEFEFDLLHLSNDKKDRETPPEMYVDALREVGVRANLKYETKEGWFEAVRSRSFDAAVADWDTNRHPGDIYDIWHSSQSEPRDSTEGAREGYRLNFSGLADERVDSLLERIDRSSNPEEQIRLGQKLHRRLHELQPSIFLYASQQPFVWRNELEGVQLSPTDPGVRSQYWFVRD